MGSRVELFEQIRRDRDREELSIRELAQRHGVHRRTVRQALASALPPERARPRSRPAPSLGRYHRLIDGWLQADRDAPPKQRHTAKRIHARLVDEHGAQVAQRTVREHVAKRRRELGLAGDAYVPQAHPPGVEAEVDWGRAEAVIAGSSQEVKLFVMRASHSGAALCVPYPAETQQAFLEAHARAFSFLGGVPERVRYDNLGSAVKKVLRGRRRTEQDRFVALRSHYLFESSFTSPGIEGAHEKGGVEGEVGRFRRSHLVPVPRVESFEELVALCERASESDLGRRIAGRRAPIAELLARERELMRPLPAEPFDCAQSSSVRVSRKALVTVRQNHYSVPVSLVGRKVSARVHARAVEITADGRVVARHERSRGRYETTAQLSHYAAALRRKPGALEGSLALSQQRERGGWPEVFDALWRKIAERTTPSEAARQMVDVAMLCDELGQERVELAVRGALAAGCADGRAVGVLARRTQRRPPEPLALDERLAARVRALPDLAAYDALLEGGR